MPSTSAVDADIARAGVRARVWAAAHKRKTLQMCTAIAITRRRITCSAAELEAIHAIRCYYRPHSLLTMASAPKRMRRVSRLRKRCAHPDCTKTEQSEKRTFAPCRECQTAFYCGKQCRDAHKPAHASACQYLSRKRDYIDPSPPPPAAAPYDLSSLQDALPPVDPPPLYQHPLLRHVARKGLCAAHHQLKDLIELWEALNKRVYAEDTFDAADAKKQLIEVAIKRFTCYPSAPPRRNGPPRGTPLRHRTPAPPAPSARTRFRSTAIAGSGPCRC